MNSKELRAASKEAARRELRFLRGAALVVVIWILAAWLGLGG